MARSARMQAFLCDPFALIPSELEAACDAVCAAYLKLIIHAWKQERPGVIPYKPRVIAYAAGKSLDDFRKIEPELASFFVLQFDGPRMETTPPTAWIMGGMKDGHERQDKYLAMQKSFGARGAKARWGKRVNNDPNADHIGSRIAARNGHSVQGDAVQYRPESKAFDRPPLTETVHQAAVPPNPQPRSALASHSANGKPPDPPLSDADVELLVRAQEAAEAQRGGAG